MKKQKISTLKKKLWAVFSEYIRKRDEGVCFTCGGNGSQAGHFIPKSIGGIELYFNERNVHAQCFRCNINLGGWIAKYWITLQQRYEIATPMELYLSIRTGDKWTAEQYLEKIETYKKKLAELNGDEDGGTKILASSCIQQVDGAETKRND